jgi:hypothetical protein
VELHPYLAVGALPMRMASLLLLQARKDFRSANRSET